MTAGTERRDLKTLTIDPTNAPQPQLLQEVEKDLSGCTTVLDLLRIYMEALKRSADNAAPEFAKMGALFAVGRTPEVIEGHHSGVALGLRVSGERRSLSHVDNVVGLLWGATLEDESPWVGKSFRRGDDAELSTVTSTRHEKDVLGFLGINHFNRLDCRPMNAISYHALTWWLGLEDVANGERYAYGHERNGGHFVACRAASVCGETPREVFSLNYRWPNLGNRPPLSWLIDEVVEIAEGLYLGQLLFASRRLLAAYDPRRPSEAEGYRHMGYFALWSPRWTPEARRLFPFLEIPVTAPGLEPPPLAALTEGRRYTTLTCEEPAPSCCDDRFFDEVRRDLAREGSVMHLLKRYSDELQDGLDNRSPYFSRLQELFNRGRPVTELDGVYRGALVSWHGAGLLDLFTKNALNLAWRGFAGRFSTWTGKSFAPVSSSRLAEITDGFETRDIPTFWGSNTQALRTMKEREVGRLMELANIWSEPVPGDEALRNGYDLKNFFFIAHAAESLNPNCRGKRIFQFNYRWPKLKTIVPDCYCIDELVEISDGLYLGQLMYATNVIKPYDPRESPEEYRYGMFGYFVLMTEEWHQLRLKIGFDLDNV
jgi:hypothetical protein